MSALLDSHHRWIGPARVFGLLSARHMATAGAVDGAEAEAVVTGSAAASGAA